MQRNGDFGDRCRARHNTLAVFTTAQPSGLLCQPGLQPSQAVCQAAIGDSQCFIEGKPTHLLALPRRRGRFGIGTGKKVPQVQVDMAFCGEVHVQVNKGWAAGRVSDRQPSLLASLPKGRVPGSLAWVKVAAGLQPETEFFVQVEHCATRATHNRRPCHVDEVGVPIEGVSQPVELC
jgi:hypothetical protein